MNRLAIRMDPARRQAGSRARSALSLRPFVSGALAGLLALAALATQGMGSFVVIDTGQDECYDDDDVITCPGAGEPFHGQDAQYDGTQPDYSLSGDGLTVDDDHTGLTWQRTPDTDDDGDLDSDDKLTWAELQSYPATLNAQSFGGYDDWRIPTIKELYSLIDFRGIDPSGYQGDPSGLMPFIDTDYFDFVYGDESAGERLIDAQYWSGTEYVGRIFDGQHAVFGVNFADGRIKGYPRDTGPNGPMREFARCVRGNPAYGANDFVDGGDGTITDSATGLMWMQDDSGVGYDWEDALAYAESLLHAGYTDWRLPNAKELQGIVDYTRSPSTTGSAAVDPLFNATPIVDEAGQTNYPFYWTGTTHANMADPPGRWAAYVAFGEALGYMGPPGMEHWMDVHGAGAQRSDPKSGDPGDWPYGHGPQGDAVRITNYVRAVRDAGGVVPVRPGDSETNPPDVGSARPGLSLRVLPNPPSRAATIVYSVPTAGLVRLAIYDVTGRLVTELFRSEIAAGVHRTIWDGTSAAGEMVPSCIYLARVETPEGPATAKILLAR